MLSSTGNDVESGANGFRVSRGDSLAENDGASQIAREESVSSDQPSSVRSSSAVQCSAKSSSQDHDDPLSPSAVHGSTPLSQIGAHPCAPVNDMYLGQGKYGSRALPTIVFTLSQDRDGSFPLFFSNDLPRLNLIEAPSS